MSKKDINTDKYINEINKLSLTDERKLEIMSNIKNDATQSKVTPFSKVGKMAIAVACACVITTVTVYAIGVLKSPAEVFSPIYGIEAEQTVHAELIDKIGTSVGLSSTSNGVTITLEGLIGDKSSACIVYTITNKDGSIFEFPDGVADENVLFYRKHGTMFTYTGHGRSSDGNMSRDENGNLQYIEKVTTEGTLPIGEILTAEFDEFITFDENHEIVTILEGDWKIEYLFDYQDTSISIDVNEMYSRHDKNYESEVNYTVESITISPVSISVSCVADVGAINEIIPNDNEVLPLTIVEGTGDDATIVEFVEMMISITPANPEVIIHKKDGTTINVNYGSFGSNNDDSISWVMTSMFKEIILLEDIDTIQVGDIFVPMP